MTAQAIPTALARASAAPSASSGNAAQAGARGWNDTLQQVQSRQNAHSTPSKNAESDHNSARQNEPSQRGTSQAQSSAPAQKNANTTKGQVTKSASPHKAKAPKHKKPATTNAAGAVKSPNKGQSTGRHQKKHAPGTAAAMAVTAPTPPSHPAATKAPTTDNGAAHGNTQQPTGPTQAAQATAAHASKTSANPSRHPSPNARAPTAHAGRAKSASQTASNAISQPDQSAGKGSKLDPGTATATTGQATTNGPTATRAQDVAVGGRNGSRETTLQTASANRSASQSASGATAGTTGLSSTLSAAQPPSNHASGGRGSNGDAVNRQTSHANTVSSLADHKANTPSTGSNTLNNPTGQQGTPAALASSPGGAMPAGGAAGGNGGVNGGTPSALTPQSVAQLNAQIHSLHQAGGGSTQIDLHPASLGAIQIHVQMQGTHQAQVTFNAAQAGTAQAIQASLPQLATSMQQQGIQLSQPQVNSGGDAGAGQTPNGGQQPGGNPAGQQSQGQPPQGQQQHSQPRQPMTALAAAEVGRRSASDEPGSTPRPGVRAYA